jgi:hypothetical protein
MIQHDQGSQPAMLPQKVYHIPIKANEHFSNGCRGKGFLQQLLSVGWMHL